MPFFTFLQLLIDYSHMCYIHTNENICGNLQIFYLSQALRMRLEMHFINILHFKGGMQFPVSLYIFCSNKLALNLRYTKVYIPLKPIS